MARASKIMRGIYTEDRKSVKIKTRCIKIGDDKGLKLFSANKLYQKVFVRAI
jgi:hypothetical protein